MNNGLNNFKKKWIQGKNDSNYIMTLPLKKSQIIGSAIFSIIIAIIPFIPLALLSIQTIMIYGYYVLAYPIILVLCLIILASIIIFFNGFISLINLKLIKCYLPDNNELNNIKYGPFFLYQLLNPGFIIFIIIVLVIFGGIL